jgi:hypothetical protein
MMTMRTPRLIAIVAVCVLAAGCGPAAAVSAATSHASGPGSARPAASSGVAASGTSAAASRSSAAATRSGGAAGCRKPASLPAGAPVQAWRLGAVRFVSPDKGLALTAPWVNCEVPLGGGRGTQVYSQAQPVRLATTSDAGRHWVTSGTELPTASQPAALEQVAAVNEARTWVVSVTGQLLVTDNAGATWARQPLPTPVVAAASAGGWLWALSCPAVTGNVCRPDVERMKLPGGTWTATRPGTSTSLLDPQLNVLSATAAVVVLPGAHPALASTADGGSRWTVRAAPAGPGNMCAGGGVSPLFTAAGPRDWWLLCNGGAAAGSSTKALMHSADAGQTWTVAASILSLSAPVRQGSLARQDAAAIAAGSARVLWLATPNTLTESTDGGMTWAQTAFNSQGTFGQFDVLSSTRAWLLAPNAGLWRTTNGTTWRQVGGTAP